MTLLAAVIAVMVGAGVFRLVWWIGSIWITGAEVLDEHPE